MTIPLHEGEPLPTRVEAQVLASLGYDASCLDMTLTYADGSPIIGEDGYQVTGGRFLDAYRGLAHREHTEDTLTGFLVMDPTDPDYPEARAYVSSYLRAYFGEPNSGTG